MKKITFILLIFNYLNTYPQEFSSGMGVVKSDLTTNTFKEDPTAEAVIIYDYGNAFFNKRTWRLNIEHKRKIKILSTDGLKRGTIEIPLYIGKTSKEDIQNISVNVHNFENGKVIVSTMDKKSIFREKNKNYELVKLVFPQVKVGSIITYSYTKTTDFVSKFVPWNFQHDIPTIYSEFNASIPGNYEYNIKLVGTIPLSINTNNVEYNCLEASRGASANCAVYRYVMENIPAYKLEKYTTTKNNYLSRIEYELSVIRKFDGGVDKITKTWDDVDGELKSDKDFGQQVSKKRLVKDIIPASISGINDKLEKATKIYQYVLDNYKWDNKSGRYDASIKRLLEEKGGNAFEINLLLQNLLKNEDLEAFAMLVSTRQNGLPTKIYPVITDFNYMIVKLVIGDKTYFLDATNPYLGFGELPFRCLNQYGRVYDTEYGSYWEDIVPSGYSMTQIGAKFKLTDNNILKGTVNRKLTGFNSYNDKQAYFENPSAYLEQLKSNYTNSSIDNHKVSTKAKNEKTFSETLDITYEESFVGDKIFFNPFVYKFYDENPFKLKQRTYPIDFGYKQAFIYTLEVDLGENLKVIELPKDSSFVLPNKAGLVTFSFKSDAEKLSVFARIKLDKPIYPAAYYDALKTFMSKIVEIQNNSIVVLEKL